mmetsp:Transcript_46921/g.118228  ORF Transcript_46921/g.118228 Transcript_46921/m.118228 type:complete len:93 (+) Transcript_46921:1276-1554(+)
MLRMSSFRIRRSLARQSWAHFSGTTPTAGAWVSSMPSRKKTHLVKNQGSKESYKASSMGCKMSRSLVESPEEEDLVGGRGGRALPIAKEWKD